MKTKKIILWMTPLLVAGLAIGCGGSDKSSAATDTAAMAGAAKAAPPPCPGNNDGLTLPAGFCATVFADSLGHARHLVVAANGDVYVNNWSGRYYTDKPAAVGFLVALRDTNHDGRADVVARFGPLPSAGATGGTGIAIYRGALYAEDGGTIVRYVLPPTGLAPTAAAQRVVGGLPITGDHPMHSFAIDTSGAMFVDLGSATNSCQVHNRTLQSLGRTPCTELATRGGVWQYDANKTGQTFSLKERFATGVRNAVGIAIGADGSVWSTQHGRDQLAENWPKLYTPEQGQNLPAEELLKLERGADYGWPNCYFDGAQQKLVLAPEFGGDGGKAAADCATKKTPAAFFPAHWAPDALLFYGGNRFPAKYRSGVFISFHGSWNRAPAPQQGYMVVFQPLSNGASSGTFETFADGFAGGHMDPGAAAHRPMGLAQGVDGALYISDDKAGRVWRVTYGASPR
ncbi:MAG: PQQ-dependent sugar dehydrogenase [Gemmatimonadaceae bacterium]